MSLTLNIPIKDAVILNEKINFDKDLNSHKTNQIVYLELLLRDDDIKQYMKLTCENFENGHIKGMYGPVCDRYNLDFFEYNAQIKINSNLSINLNSNKCNKFLYAIKSKKDQYDQIVGFMEIYLDYDYCPEIGIFIDSHHVKKNYGTQATQIAIQFLTNNAGVNKIKWECNSHNLGSIGIAKKCGFETYNQDNIKTILYWHKPKKSTAMKCIIL